MLFLTKPATQDRLNAAVVEVIGLNVMGPVSIPGTLWSASNALEYTETKLKQPLTLFQDLEHGIYFQVNNKRVCFNATGVVIFPLDPSSKPMQ